MQWVAQIARHLNQLAYFKRGIYSIAFYASFYSLVSAICVSYHIYFWTTADHSFSSKVHFRLSKNLISLAIDLPDL